MAGSGLVSASTDTTTPDSTAPAEAGEGAYPVTIAHKYGETTVEEFPERTAVVGLLEQDALLALGVVPVGDDGMVRAGTPAPCGRGPRTSSRRSAPSVRHRWAGRRRSTSRASPPRTDPDLILALYSGLTDQDYELLSAIAPTIAQPGEYIDFGIPWEELTRTVGQVVGKAAEADALVADVKAGFAVAQEAHSEFVGATSVMATPYEGVWVYGPEDVRGRFLTDLGFELSTKRRAPTHPWPSTKRDARCSSTASTRRSAGPPRS